MSVMKSTTSGHGSTRAWAYDSAIRSYIVRTSALDRPIPGTRRYLRIKSRSGPEGRAMNLLGGAASDVIERRERSDHPAAIQILREGGRHLRAARRARPNADLVCRLLLEKKKRHEGNRCMRAGERVRRRRVAARYAESLSLPD